jgi:hypothetical protein
MQGSECGGVIIAGVLFGLMVAVMYYGFRPIDGD